MRSIFDKEIVIYGSGDNSTHDSKILKKSIKINEIVEYVEYFDLFTRSVGSMTFDQTC